MNREDIIRMAKEAGLAKTRVYKHVTKTVIKDVDELERFAALVAAEKNKKIKELEDFILELQERME